MQKLGKGYKVKPYIIKCLGADWWICINTAPIAGVDDYYFGDTPLQAYLNWNRCANEKGL